MGPAPADIAFHGMRDLRLRWIGVCAQKRNGGHDHSRRAISTLHRGPVEERLLHGMQMVSSCQPFNRCDLFLADCSYLSNARPARGSIDQNRTSTTLALAASILT